MSVVSDTSHILEALFYSSGWAKKGSPSCSSAGRHVLCICLQTQGVSAVPGHVGRTQIFIQLQHGRVWAVIGQVKTGTLELCQHIHSEDASGEGCCGKMPTCCGKVPTSTISSSHAHSLQWLQNGQPAAGTSTTWLDGVGLVCLSNRTGCLSFAKASVIHSHAGQG